MDVSQELKLLKMTETKNGTEAIESQDPNVTELKIIRQIEYYFGDYNLSRDKFLKDTIKNDDGWVAMETMLKFQRLAQLSKDSAEIIKSLKKSSTGLMEVDEEKARIRRSPSKPLPENEIVQKEQAKMTVYVKGFEKEKTTLDDLLDFFNKSAKNVINVFKRTWPDKKTKERFFKGSVFVTYKDRESAEEFMAIPSVKNPEGEELIRKWQEDYNEEKKNEFEAKKKRIDDHKAGAKKVKEIVERSEGKDQEEENRLPKGAVLKLDKLNETTTREMLREKLEKDFGVSFGDIAFIYYNKGEPSASLRLKEENAAKNLKEKIAASLKVDGDENEKKLEINGTEVEFDVLEGEEETAFLDKCLADMTQMKNKSRGGHKRRGGFQGRGGAKRSRR